MPVRQTSGVSSGPTGESATERGWTPLKTKKAWAPAHIDNAGATALNARRLQPWPFRHDRMQLSTASETAAGPGPNSMAETMKNVSSTAMLASIVAILMVNEAVTIASTAKRNHSSG